MQKFHKGDHVRVASDLGPHMSHFQADCEAIVIGSYKDQYGGSNSKSYTIHIKGRGKVSWYEEWQLELLEANRLDLLAQWEGAANAEAELKGDMDWIFANGDAVLNQPHGATLAALGKALGIDDLWGSRGEGIDCYTNALSVLAFSEPYLRAGDRVGFECAASAIMH